MNAPQLNQMETAEVAAGKRLSELKEENELLLSQLHQVQEELERYFHQCRALESKGNVAVTRWVDDELPQVMAENQRLRAIVEVQKKAHLLEVQNALSNQVGDVLIKGVESPGALLAVPGKLGRIWRESKQNVPPQALGGKKFDKVFGAYAQGGLEAVERLLNSVSISPAMRANAYTALARHLMNSSCQKAAEAARHAYEIDPRPYRLKWLAFRLHDAGELNEADAILDILPQDMQFSDSEMRQVHQIRRQAKVARLNEAKQQTGFSECRAEVNQQLTRLTEARNEQAKLAVERAREIEALQAAQARLVEEKSALMAQYNTQVQLAADRAREIEALRAAQARLADEKSALSAQCSEQTQLAADQAREIEALQAAQARLAEEKSALSAQCSEQTQLAAHQAREIEALRAAQARLADEKSALSAQCSEQTQLAVERAREIETLQAAQVRLAEEKSALTVQYGEQMRLAEERAREIEALQAVKTQLAEEKAALAGLHHEQAKLAAERARENEALRAAKAQQEAEKSVLAAERAREIEALQAAQAQLSTENLALARRYDEQAKLAAERLKQINQLQQQIQSRQSAEAELTARQQFMHEELVRAEAQLDLIKAMLLKEQGI